MNTKGKKNSKYQIISSDVAGQHKEPNTYFFRKLKIPKNCLVLEPR